MNPNEIIKMACKGDKHAEQFCLSWYEFAHLVDDCADEPHKVNGEGLAKRFSIYTVTLCCNPFFLKHRAELMALMLQSANYWAESNHRHGVERDILKSFWHSVIYHCALIIGGWQWMRHMMRETLEFDYEKEAV